MPARPSAPLRAATGHGKKSWRPAPHLFAHVASLRRGAASAATPAPTRTACLSAGCTPRGERGRALPGASLHQPPAPPQLQQRRQSPRSPSRPLPRPGHRRPGSSNPHPLLPTRPALSHRADAAAAPRRYRTQLCKEGALCKRGVCFFAHSMDELREPLHLHGEGAGRARLPGCCGPPPGAQAAEAGSPPRPSAAQGPLPATRHVCACSKSPAASAAWPPRRRGPVRGRGPRLAHRPAHARGRGLAGDRLLALGLAHPQRRFARPGRRAAAAAQRRQERAAAHARAGGAAAQRRAARARRAGRQAAQLCRVDAQRAVARAEHRQAGAARAAPCLRLPPAQSCTPRGGLEPGAWQPSITSHPEPTPQRPPSPP